jgi:hypothetical protein
MWIENFILLFCTFMLNCKSKIAWNDKLNKAKYHCKHITYILHCLLEYRINTDLQNGYIVVRVAWVVPVVNMASYHLVNISAKRVVCGASSYCEMVPTRPIYRKILKFALYLVLQ